MVEVEFQVPWDRVIMLVMALAVMICATCLAASGVAPWEDVFTIFMVILTGFGFVTAGYYAGRARTYEGVLKDLGITELKARLKRGE